jgi:hypothetical protein
MSKLVVSIYQYFARFVEQTCSFHRETTKRVSDCEIRYEGNEFGACWQNAFGILPQLNMCSAFRTLEQFLDGVSSWPIAGEAAAMASVGLDVACELDDLVSAIGQPLAWLTDGKFMVGQGRNGLLVCLGRSRRLPFPLWHVCSLEEIALFYDELKRFTEMISDAQRNFGLAWSPTSDCLEESLVYVGSLYAPLVCTQVEVTESQFYPPSDFESTLDLWDPRSRLARVSSVFRPYVPQVQASANLLTSLPLPLGTSLQVNAAWESAPRIVLNYSP